MKRFWHAAGIPRNFYIFGTGSVWGPGIGETRWNCYGLLWLPKKIQKRLIVLSFYLQIFMDCTYIVPFWHHFSCTVLICTIILLVSLSKVAISIYNLWWNTWKQEYTKTDRSRQAEHRYQRMGSPGILHLPGFYQWIQGFPATFSNQSARIPAAVSCPCHPLSILNPDLRETTHPQSPLMIWPGLELCQSLRPLRSEKSDVPGLGFGTWIRFSPRVGMMIQSVL